MEPDIHRDSSACTEASLFADSDLPGPLAHRLANIASPIAVGVELSHVGPLDVDLEYAMTSAVKHLERVSRLLAAVAGRRPVPVADLNPGAVLFTGDRLAVQELPAARRTLLEAFVTELYSGAVQVGATEFRVEVTHQESAIVCRWIDNGSGFAPGVLDSLGRVQVTGRGGCGLGLAAVAVAARLAGAHIGSSAGNIVLVLPAVSEG